MQRALAGLTLEESGFVLGAALGRRGPEFARETLAEPSASRCAEALERLGSEAQAARAGTLAWVLSIAREAAPVGLERIHPGWLRDRLDGEPSAIVREVTAGLGRPVEGLGTAIVWERGRSEGKAGPQLSEPARAALQRIVFGGLVPLGGPGAPRGPTGRRMLELEPDALDEEIRRRGAEVLGVSLRGAAQGTIARAAAALEPELASILLAAAAREGTREERDGARDLVAAAGAPANGDIPFEIGLRALGAALAGEGTHAVLAVAQRMPLPTGQRLVAAATPIPEARGGEQAGPWDG